MTNVAPVEAPAVSRNPTLTHRQRVQRMFNRDDHDRVPRHESFWSDTITRWETEGLVGGTQGVLDLLDGDFQGICWVWPQCFPGEEYTVSQDDQTRIVRDGQGKTVRYWRHRMGTPEHLGFDCDSREKWDRVYKPALLRSGLQQDPEAVRRAYERARRQDKWVHLTGVESFEEIRSLIGDEAGAIAMADDPDWIVDISQTFTTQVLRNFDAMMATGIEPDGLWIYGDMAFNHATFCSPAMYRELIWPDHKRLADWAHAHNMKFIYHTDGNVNGVIDLWLDAGFDCFQPIEAKAQMDIRNLCPKYGDKLAIFGNIDVMLMSTNDPEQIEEEIKSKFAAGKATKGYVYHSDHSVPPAVSWETYQRIIALVDQYGWY